MQQKQTKMVILRPVEAHRTRGFMDSHSPGSKSPHHQDSHSKPSINGVGPHSALIVETNELTGKGII